VKSWQVLREAVDRVGVKAVAAKLGVSTALVYKWCQESPRDDDAASGARNPLDRLEEIYSLTRDADIINWLCQIADGFFVANPKVEPGEAEENLLGTTQRMVEKFGHLLSNVSRSVENDGQISHEEAQIIRQTWESLKTTAECFVAACEKGMYRAGK
jgi:hypothetical protein